MALHFLVLVVLLSLSSAAHAASSPAPPALSTAAKEYLEAHNQARAAVGVPSLKWSEKLAIATNLLVRYQRNKMNCQFANLTSRKYGGNQLWTSGAVMPRMAVENWVKEKEYYNYVNNSCTANHQCGVYTQVVWKNSLELGCAQGVCMKDQASLTICFYNPPGNFVGEKPY